MRTAATALLTAALFAACAPSRRAAFEPVRARVEERLGRQVRWVEDEEDARLVDEAVRRLLSRDLHVEDAVQLALLHDRGLRARFAELGVARARVLQAASLPNPQLQAQVLAPVGEGEARGTLQAQLDFLAVLLLPERRAHALADLEAARLELLALVLDVAGDVSARFYTVLAARQRAALLEELVELNARALEVTERRVVEGEVDRLDLLVLRAEAVEARLELLGARAEAAAARSRLGAALGLVDEARWRVPASLPEAPSEPSELRGLVERARERSVALELARRRVEVAARALGIADSARLLPGLSPGVAGEVEDGDLFIGPQVQLDLPLFSQGQGTLAEREAELQARREEYRARLVELATTADATGAQLELTRARLALLDEQGLPLRRELVAEATRAAAADTLEELEVLEARRALIDVKLQRVDVLRDFWIAQTRYELLLRGGHPEGMGSLALER